MINIKKYVISEAFEQLSKSAVKLDEATLKKPKYWNSIFTTKVIDAYNNKELTSKNIEEWETNYNGGKKPNPSLGTKEILDYYIKTKKDPRLSESKLTEAPLRPQEYAAKMKSRREQSKVKNPLDKINDQLNPDMSITDQLQVYFDELVPAQGKADTVAGELVRAMMRLLYRDYNDGDLFYTGYGKETCGGSTVYLLDHVEDMERPFMEIVHNLYENDEYTDKLHEAAYWLISYLNNHPELFIKENTIDSRSVDESRLEEYFSLPTYEFDCDTSYDDSYYDVDNEDIDDFVRSVVESDLSSGSVNRWASDAWIIEDLDKEDYDTLEEMWEKWFSDFLSEYEREPDEEEDDMEESLKEDFSDDETWEFISRKQVQDSDGFWTDYTLYYNPNEGRYVCIFGDSDIYTPENSDPDFECEEAWEAFEWFDSYNGFEEDEDFDESLKEDTVKQGNHWVNKGDSGETHGKFTTKKAADAQRKAMFANGYKG